MLSFYKAFSMPLYIAESPLCNLYHGVLCSRKEQLSKAGVSDFTYVSRIKDKVCQ